MTALEKTELRLGLVPLIDAAPLVIAQRKGFFARRGLRVELCVEGAWASVRDKVAAGVLDAAQMLAPMPIAAMLGIDGVGVPMLTAMSLNLNGNAISVAEALYWRLQPVSDDPLAVGQALRRVLDADRAAGAPPRVFAHVFPFSMHHYELRYWLAGCGIDPDRDLQLVVIPPPQMVEQLRQGRIDGFCVGAPWGAVAEASGIGRRIAGTYRIWNNSPEKVLGVTQAWALSHPQTHLALLAALIEACRWLDLPANRMEAAELLTESAILDVRPDLIREALRAGGDPAAHEPCLVFHQGAANFPWVSHAVWCIRQMQRWGQAPAQVDAPAVARRVYRAELYRQAAAMAGVDAPLESSKVEGEHAAAWSTPGTSGPVLMGADRFFDGGVFIP